MLDSRPPRGEDHQDLLTEKIGYHLYRPLLIVDHVIYYVLEDLAYV